MFGFCRLLFIGWFDGIAFEFGLWFRMGIWRGFDSLHDFGVGLLVVGCLSVVSLWFTVCLSSLVFVVSFLGFDLLLILAV